MNTLTSYEKEKYKEHMTPLEYKQGLQAYITKQRKLINNRDDIADGYKSLLDMSDLWLGQVCPDCFDLGAVGSMTCPCFRVPRMMDLHARIYPVSKYGNTTTTS